MTDPAASRPKRGLAVASLVLGLVGLPTFGVLCAGAMASVSLGVAALVKARREPALYGGQRLAVAGIVLSAASVLVTPFVAGFVAAFVIPYRERAKVASNEAAALADVQTLATAELSFRQRHGTFVLPECLEQPEVCLGGARRPSMLPKGFVATGAHAGYNRMFQPRYPEPPLPPGTSPLSVISFVYVATPLLPGRTGTRTFCADVSGRACYVAGPVPDEAETCPCTAP